MSTPSVKSHPRPIARAGVSHAETGRRRRRVSRADRVTAPPPGPDAEDEHARDDRPDAGRGQPRRGHEALDERLRDDR